MITLENSDGIEINIDPSTVDGIEDGGPAGCVLRIGAARVSLKASAELLAELTGVAPDKAPEPDGKPEDAPPPPPPPEPEPEAPRDEAAPAPEPAREPEPPPPEPKKSGKKR